MENKSSNSKNKKKILCGLTSGLVQAFVFNPWDRALYLSVKNDINFLSINNFKQPFSGVLQTLGSRIISSGLYFPLEEIFRDIFYEIKSSTSTSLICVTQSPLIKFASGSCAGALNGFIMNPLSAIKYQYWGKNECEQNFITTAKSMFAKGKFRPFFVGTSATIIRDLLFGGTFAILRHEILYINDKEHIPSIFFVNLISGCFATVISSPMNYVRNMHYATSPDKKAISTLETLDSLYQKSKSSKNLIGRFLFLQRQLRIGWGTLRVGCGMALGAQIYARCTKRLDCE